MENIGHESYERLSNLTDKEWGNIFLKLRLHAEYIVQRKTWKTPEGMLPKGYDAAEIANEAICRLLMGSRKWDPQKEPEILKVLMGTVSSIASELVESPDHIIGNRFGQVEDDAVVMVLPSSVPNPQMELETKEEAEELRDWIWSHLKDEEEQEIVLCIEEGIEKPAAIAKEIKQPVERVYQVLRNMRRRLNEKRKEMSQLKQEGLR